MLVCEEWSRGTPFLMSYTSKVKFAANFKVEAGVGVDRGGRDRQWVQDAAVDQHAVVDDHRRQHARYRDRGADPR